jgi:hypothetical protein
MVSLKQKSILKILRIIGMFRWFKPLFIVEQGEYHDI